VTDDMFVPADDILKRIEASTLSLLPDIEALEALERWHAAPPTKPKRRARKPTLAAALKQASKAGQHVSGAVIEDGKIELKFGEQTNNEPNP
jgi:hypothetical protein